MIWRIATVMVMLLEAGCSQRQPARTSVAPRPAAAATSASNLPPTSWTCPMHPDIIEDAAGTCPLCKMALEQVRLDSIWSCPVHSVVVERKGGKCPICRRELAPMTVALSFTCPDRPGIDQVDPGTCPDGSAMIPKHTPRAHGNHSPQHGGGFFMASDNWHHIEGTYPDTGVFRLFVYDDYSKPLAADRMKHISGRVITKSSFDPATGVEREVTAYPLKPIDNAPYLEARIDRLAPPTEMAVKVRFTADGPESRFDFMFTALTKDPVGAAVATAAIDPSQLVVEIPNDAAAILAMLKTRNQQLQTFINQGEFDQLYVPAMQAKDLAIALEVHAATLSAGRRSQAQPAVVDLVRAAWMLDAYGDMGNRQQIAGAYAVFASAFSKLEKAFNRAAPREPGS